MLYVLNMGFLSPVNHLSCLFALQARQSSFNLIFVSNVVHMSLFVFSFVCPSLALFSFLAVCCCRSFSQFILRSWPSVWPIPSTLVDSAPMCMLLSTQDGYIDWYASADWLKQSRSRQEDMAVI